MKIVKISNKLHFTETGDTSSLWMLLCRRTKKIESILLCLLQQKPESLGRTTGARIQKNDAATKKKKRKKEKKKEKNADISENHAGACQTLKTQRDDP